jgi:hypothetical protein
MLIQELLWPLASGATIITVTPRHGQWRIFSSTYLRKNQYVYFCVGNLRVSLNKGVLPFGDVPFIHKELGH